MRLERHLNGCALAHAAAQPGFAVFSFSPLPMRARARGMV